MDETEEAFVRLCRLLGMHPQMVENLEVFEAAADEISKLRAHQSSTLQEAKE